MEFSKLMYLELGLERENLSLEFHITIIIRMCHTGLADRLVKYAVQMEFWIKFS